jgi:RNA polymerase sigma-70 factor, ECF subfamily
MNPKDDDAALALRIAAGDRDALAHVYRRESGRVYRYALAMTHNADMASDATQDTFMSFSSNPSGFDATRGTLQGYLVGITRHWVLSAWNADKRFVDAAPEDVAEPLDEHDPSGLLIEQQSAEQLMQALAQLPPVFREAIVLVELQEYSYVDAAALAGIELNTLRTRVFRAKQKLAALLRGEAKMRQAA